MPNNSEGCLIVAFDTAEVNYTQQAIEAANRVKKYIGIPVTIITDDATLDYNKIIVERPINNKRGFINNPPRDWYNLVRTQLYDLTLYDRTLVIDSDFYISTNSLLPHIKSSRDFLMAKEIYDIAPRGKTKIEKIHSSPIPMYWATVMIFNKSSEAMTIFEMAKSIQKHYAYYAALYGFHTKPIRNDYIFSFACHLAGGYGLRDYGLKNYPLINCDGRSEYISWKDNKLVYYYEGRQWANRLSNVDLHLMNKDQL